MSSRIAPGEANLQAIDLYQRSLAADPRFALAYVGLAYATINQMYFDGQPVKDIAGPVEQWLAKAEELEPDLSELHAVRAALRAEQGRTADAFSELNRAVALNPNDSWAFAELARLYSVEAQPRSSLQNLQRALALDPLDYLLHARQCVVLQDLARYVQATAACERARSLQGQGSWATVVTEWLALSQGDLVQALAWSGLALKSDPQSIGAYERRGAILLTLGMASDAKHLYEQARAATHDDEAASIGLAKVAFYEGGADALRFQLATTRLEQSEHARSLIEAAHFRLLLGDAAQARRLMTTAMLASDFDSARFNGAWFARWGWSDQLILATAELQVGESASATQHLEQISELLERMMAAGEERFGIYALKAQVLALSGNAAGAMQALTRAVDLGWRYAWWAQREPYLASLWSRSDFRALMARVEALNQRARAAVKPDP